MNHLMGKCSGGMRSMILNWTLCLSKALSEFKNKIFSGNLYPYLETIFIGLHAYMSLNICLFCPSFLKGSCYSEIFVFIFVLFRCLKTIYES